MFKAAHEMLSERVRTSESERERLAAELGAHATQHKLEMCRDSASSSQPLVSDRSVSESTCLACRISVGLNR